MLNEDVNNTSSWQLPSLGGIDLPRTCNHHMKRKTMNEEKLVFRQLALPVHAFDYLKDRQRDYESRHGVKLSNSQVLTIILTEHKALTASR